MGKEKTVGARKEKKPVFPLAASSRSIDPTLDLLFSTSFGPVKAPDRVDTKFVDQQKPSQAERNGAEKGQQRGFEVLDANDCNLDHKGGDDNEELKSDMTAKGQTWVSLRPTNKKRRRSENGEDLEDRYLRRIREEEHKEIAQRKRKPEKIKLDTEDRSKNAVQEQYIDPDVDSVSGSESENEEVDESRPIAHETQLPQKESEGLEKAARTVFLGNVPTSAITSKADYKVLKSTFSAVGEISSIRFRSIAFAEQMSRKIAFLSKKFHEKQQTVNTYIVYTKTQAAREALKLNGTMILDRHIRVDSVAHPSPHGAKRCVFIGNLDFEAQEENIWRHFASCGKIEFVRIVRDAKTNVGKGFAYVQFEDVNSVEKALLLDGQKMPKDRKLRVSRARNIKKPKTKPRNPGALQGKSKAFVPKKEPRRGEMLGRAKKLLGKAGGAIMKKTPEIFEGVRATRDADSKVRLGRKKGRPHARATKRSAAWKSKTKK